MTARDNLSPDQFMHVADIGKMKSANMRDGGSVSDWNDSYRASNAARYHPGLDADVAANGVRIPLDVGIAHSDKHESVLYNGHHRYAAAVKAGHTHVPVTTETSWSSKNKQPEREAE